MVFLARMCAASSAAAFLAAAAWGQSCTNSSLDWQNQPFEAQTREFEARFDAVPAVAGMDGVTALSASEAARSADIAAAVRFNRMGFIDALNGGGYGADVRMAYAAGAVYRFRLNVNPVTRRYSVHVTAPGTGEKALASNYAFNPWHGAPVLGFLSLRAGSGSHQACDFHAASTRTDMTAPNVSITAPFSGAIVVGALTVSGRASDNTAVALVQIAVDNGPPMPATGTTTWSSSALWLSNGPHVVTAQAEDSSGNVSSASVVVIVRN